MAKDLAREANRRLTARALEKLYRVMGLRDRLSAEEVRSEAYYAWHKGLITREQALALGCRVNGVVGPNYRTVVK